MIKIEDAQKEQATMIAHLIMEAMNHECCQWFAGPNHSLKDFHQLITKLVEREDSQYSYLNTLVAITETNKIVGICVSYDGAKLRELRKGFQLKELWRLSVVTFLIWRTRQQLVNYILTHFVLTILSVDEGLPSSYLKLQ